MNWKAAKTSALLCVLFVVVYNGCNYLTSLRHDVPSFYFGWERHIPFLPVFIIPYMSIDLFFVAAPFLCKDDSERQILSRRIVAAILIAGACFLLFPFKFAFDRPVVSGWQGVIFNNFRNVDKPFNEFPSLHMALRTILALHYFRRSRGLLRWLLLIWFSLIGFSTLFTYQHHFIDVAGGLFLGGLCVYFFQISPLRSPVICNRRAGAYYACGAIALIALTISLQGWAWLFLWPALSLSLVAAAYFGLGPAIFRKQNGKIPFAARLVLWPVLLGQRISLIYYARQASPWNELSEHIWIGRKLNAAEARAAMQHGVKAILDLTSELTEAGPFQSAAYCNEQVMDLTAPTEAQLQGALNFIAAQIAGGVVYIHCKAGYSRTAAIAGAWLLSTRRAASAADAIAQLRAVRPRIVIRPEILVFLRKCESRWEIPNCGATTMQV